MLVQNNKKNKKKNTQSGGNVLNEGQNWRAQRSTWGWLILSFSVVDCTGTYNSNILPAVCYRMFINVLFYLGFMSFILCLCVTLCLKQWQQSLMLNLKLLKHFLILVGLLQCLQVKTILVFLKNSSSSKLYYNLQC